MQQPLAIPLTKRIAAKTLCDALRVYEKKYQNGARYLISAKLECEIDDVDLCVVEKG
jgi:hypothetical protein